MRIALLVSAVLILLSPRVCVAQNSTTAAKAELTQIANMFHRGASEREIISSWERFIRSHPKTNVDWAVSFLREETGRQGAANIARARQRLLVARKMQEAVKTELDYVKGEQRRGAVTAHQVHKKDFEYKGNAVVVRDARVASGGEAYRRELEEKLNAVGDDAQLANVDLQNVLQRQQQALQMMSNISKMLHDTAMAIIRKIGG